MYLCIYLSTYIYISTYFSAHLSREGTDRIVSWRIPKNDREERSPLHRRVASAKASAEFAGHGGVDARLGLKAGDGGSG